MIANCFEKRPFLPILCCIIKIENSFIVQNKVFCALFQIVNIF